MKIDLNGDYFYIFSIDFSIPDDVKIRTDDLPPSIKKREVFLDDLSPFSKNLLRETNQNFAKTESLICDHSSQENYLISLNMLKLFIEMGVKIEKVNYVYRFDQDFIFKDFIEKNIELRKN